MSLIFLWSYFHDISWIIFPWYFVIIFHSTLKAGQRKFPPHQVVFPWYFFGHISLTFFLSYFLDISVIIFHLTLKAGQRKFPPHQVDHDDQNDNCHCYFLDHVSLNIFPQHFIDISLITFPWSYFLDHISLIFLWSYFLLTSWSIKFTQHTLMTFPWSNFLGHISWIFPWSYFLGISLIVFPWYFFDRISCSPPWSIKFTLHTPVPTINLKPRLETICGEFQWDDNATEVNKQYGHWIICNFFFWNNALFSKSFTNRQWNNGKYQNNWISQFS